ncbi:hypothetical protein PVAND_013733 [Polypedilum vanderplanki]|uniref:C-type lectin domain-containing protein n=1 Tax=Polypedilum vanderplanki TaxID=319348 RepID=A0A9J6CRL6_POLVA|nr:hypothetical protein PVAND_013733 [Polypedilum vanderplanki]
MIKLLFSLSVLCVAATTGQRIMTIQLDGIQYYISRMNPYSPELNYYLAYQYCRSLGLQLASFDSKEKYNSMVEYLTNAKFNNFDFWTSGNRLGTGMFLWMSTGLPFNATFDYFDHESNGVDPVDHNGNTAPQRTARDDTRRPLDKNCVLLKAPKLKWEADDCLQVKDFICEQTRCYYYNYGSIPVSSSQGRKISASVEVTSTTTQSPLSYKDTTALYVSLMGATRSPTSSEEEEVEDEHSEEHSVDETTTEVAEEEEVHGEEEEHHTTSEDSSHTESSESTVDERVSHEDEEVPVEQRLRELTDDLGRLQQINSDDETRQSFLSLSDLIKNLRHEDDKPLQIDSSYSRSKVLGEKPDIVYHPRNTGDVANRSLFKK